MKRQVYKTTSKQVRINSELHKKMKLASAEKGVSVKFLLEEIIEEQIGK